jgi:hypothetical protein
MLDDIIRHFLGSPAAEDATREITDREGLDPDQARTAVEATAKGGADAMRGLDPGALLTTLGGGGLGTLAGALGLGGGGGGSSGLPRDIERQVNAFVSERTGLSPAVASAVVAVVLPKVVAFARDALGGGETHARP